MFAMVESLSQLKVFTLERVCIDGATPHAPFRSSSIRELSLISTCWHHQNRSGLLITGCVQCESLTITWNTRQSDSLQPLLPANLVSYDKLSIDVSAVNWGSDFASPFWTMTFWSTSPPSSTGQHYVYKLICGMKKWSNNYWDVLFLWWILPSIIPPLEWIPLSKYDALKELCPTLTVLVVDQRDKFPVNALKIANQSIFVPLPSQQRLYDLVVDHVEAVRAGYPVNQLLLLIHGGAGSGKSAMTSALFQFIIDNHGSTLAFKGAATDYAAAVIGGVSLASSPHTSTIDCGQQYFFIDAANALDVAILSNLSTQLNDIHHTPSAIFWGKNVILFADFFQTPPQANHYNAIWCPHEVHDAIIQPFLSNVFWLKPEPIHLLPDSSITDKIRLNGLVDQDFLRLNSHIVKPSDFVSTHANEKFAVITTSSIRCKRLNMELPIHVANALNTTIYMLYATDTISFSVGATMPIADRELWGYSWQNGSVAEELLLHNVDLKPFLHLKPVRRRYNWFMDNDNAEWGYVVRLQVPIAPRLAIVEKECEGQLFDHLLLDTQHGLQSLCSLYLVASRVPNINLLSVTHKVQHSSDVGWLLSLRETILRLLYL
ncbi:hypothetical protein GG344DRAFT_65299 [Lentinula edodes]|nr:hypothetical protein GG344DRAFT_65299 [Lentinula edodes]